MEKCRGREKQSRVEGGVLTDTSQLFWWDIHVPTGIELRNFF